MTTEDINIFLSICRCGSISKAANELFTSQSSVSYKLSVLEDELGAKLFIRQKGISKLSLTDAGESFFIIAQKMKDLYAEALHVGEEETRTSLLVAGVDSVNCYFLNDFYPAFIHENPDIELKVVNEYTGNILNKVDDCLYDIGLSNDYYNLGSIHSYALFEEQFVCLKRCREDEKTEDIDPISINDLDLESEVFQGFTTSYIQWRKSMSLQFRPKFMTEIVKMGVRLMDTPGDWMIMPYTTAKYYHDRSPFQIYRLVSPPSPRVLYVTTNTRTNAHNAKAIAAFKSALNVYTEKNCIDSLLVKI